MAYVISPYQVTGLIPAAGEGTRLGVLPCSKEIYPIGIRPDSSDKTSNVKVAMHYVMEKMKHAGITRIFVVINKNKWDIPKYFKDGSMVGVNISYLVMDSSPGVPFTLDQAYPFIGETDLALGLPDILFKSDDAYFRLLEKRRITNADIVLGCFPVKNKGKFAMATKFSWILLNHEHFSKAS